MIRIITKRKINQIFSRFPSWTQEDINYLSYELKQRKQNLNETLNKLNASQVRDKSRLASQEVLLNEGLKKLEQTSIEPTEHGELLKTLFNHYLKRDNRRSGRKVGEAYY